MTQDHTVHQAPPVIQPRPIGDGELFARAEDACAEARALVVERHAHIADAKAYAEDQRAFVKARIEKARQAVHRFYELRLVR